MAFSFTIPAFATNGAVQTYTEVVAGRTLTSECFIGEDSVTERFTISKDGVVSVVVERIVYSDGRFESYIDGVLAHEESGAPYDLFLEAANGNLSSIDCEICNSRAADPCPFWDTVHTPYSSGVTRTYNVATMDVVDSVIASIIATFLFPVLSIPGHVAIAVAIARYVSDAAEDENINEIDVTETRFSIFPENYSRMICCHVLMSGYEYTSSGRVLVSNEWSYYQVEYK